MSNTTNGSDMRMVSSDSASVDEGHSGGNLKKGPWTTAEDAILIEYVKKYGEGNWNAVQKNSGLLRCGKSCRLRWANHLRPHLKKGAFTAEEERKIIELHALMGNKWARMAVHLPGRTDNEIKNYWNTRIKRRMRAGLPLYPPDVSIRVSNENMNQSSGDFNIANSDYGYAEPDLDDFTPNTGTSLYLSQFTDNSFGNLLTPGLEKSGLFENIYNSIENNSESFSSSYGYHGDYSVSGTFSETVNPELPSFQMPYHGLDLDNVDNTYVQSQEIISVSSECGSSRNDGLLDDILPVSLRRKSTCSDIFDCSTLSDPTSPLGCSAESVFSESTPPSLDEFQAIRGTDMISSSSNTTQPRLDFTRPDYMLAGATWIVENSQAAKAHNDMNNALATILGEDNRAKQVDIGSCLWNNMPPARQLP